MRPFKPRLSPEEEKERMQAYEGGLSDREAALRFGITRYSFMEWRYRRGLPSIRLFGITSTYQKVLAQILAARKSGMRIAEIAKKFNMKHVRRKLNLARIITQTNMTEGSEENPIHR